MNVTDWCLLALAILLMGSTFLFISIALRDIPPVTSAAIRTIIAAPICWAVMRALGMRLPPLGRAWGAIIVVGLLMSGIPFAAVSWGQQHIASGLTGILYGTIPIMVVVMAPMFLSDEIFTRRRLVGALIGFGGLILVVGPSVLANATSQIAGIAVTLIAPFSQTLGTIYTRRNVRMAPPVLAAGQLFIAALFLTMVTFLVEAPLEMTPGTEAILAIVVAGTFCTAGAMSLFFLVLSRIGASRSAIMPMMIPVVAVLLGVIILGEQLPLEAFLGLALIMAGAIAVGSRSRPGQVAPASEDQEKGQTRSG